MLQFQTALTDNLQKVEVKISSMSMRLNNLNRKQSVTTEEHFKTKQMLEEYSGSCKQLHNEIYRLVAQLEEFRSKAENERNRKLEDAVRSSDKLKSEKLQLSESYMREMQQSRVLIEQKE